MKHIAQTADSRRELIEWWSSYGYPNTERDITRVYAFRELDSQSATDEQVTLAYGDETWKKECVECGERNADRVEFDNGSVVCVNCLTAAAALVAPVAEEAAPEPAAVAEPAAAKPKRRVLSFIKSMF